MYWDDVLKEVLNKQNKEYHFRYTNVHDGVVKKEKKDTTKRGVKKADKKTYYLGGEHTDVYFTQREAECMVHLLRGETIRVTAGQLKLSPRTVEFYVKNMKRKLNCRTKSELIGLVLKSDFMQVVKKEWLSVSSVSDGVV